MILFLSSFSCAQWIAYNEKDRNRRIQCMYTRPLKIDENIAGNKICEPQQICFDQNKWQMLIIRQTQQVVLALYFLLCVFTLVLIKTEQIQIKQLLLLLHIVSTQTLLRLQKAVYRIYLKEPQKRKMKNHSFYLLLLPSMKWIVRCWSFVVS